MNPDLMITIAFCLEVALLGLVAGMLIARIAREAHVEAAAEVGEAAEVGWNLRERADARVSTGHPRGFAGPGTRRK